MLILPTQPKHAKYMLIHNSHSDSLFSLQANGSLYRQEFLEIINASTGKCELFKFVITKYNKVILVKKKFI